MCPALLLPPTRWQEDQSFPGLAEGLMGLATPAQTLFLLLVAAGTSL